MSEQAFHDLGKMPCSSLCVCLKSNGVLQSQKSVQVQIQENGTRIDVSIQQSYFREISLNVSGNLSLDVLWSYYENIEQLLMLFDGQFYSIVQAEFSFDGADEGDNERYALYAKERINQRLTFYTSSDICGFQCMGLINYVDLMDSELIEKWFTLKVELDIVHSVFLYCLADTGVPVDLKCAHIIEIFEPLVELISKYNNFFPHLNINKTPPPLRICLDSIISQYGKTIFDREVNCNKDNFLRLLVNSRVRIMHVKSMQKDKYFNGEECVIYIAKLSLMYRRVLFSLLGIKDSIFESQLRAAVDWWNAMAESYNADTLWSKGRC